MDSLVSQKPVLAILALCVFLFGCKKEKTEQTSTGPASQPVQRAQLSYDSPVFHVPANQMRQIYLDAYRLKPDRRFLLAIAEVDRLFSGNPKREIETQFASGRWKILYNKSEIGTVPEFPNYSDFSSFLSSWITKLAKINNLKIVSAVSSSTSQSSSIFLFPQCVEKLKDQHWDTRKPNPESLIESARILVNLSLQSLDRTEIADLIPAKALAVTSIAKVLSGAPMLREEALLSYEMGYGKHAWDVAMKLPQTEAARLFIEEKDDQLKRLALAETATDESQYLFLKRLAAKHDATSWYEISEKFLHGQSMPLTIIKTGIDVGQFETNLLARQARIYTLEAISLQNALGSRSKELQSMSIKQMSQEFDSSLSKLSKNQNGDLWDSELCETFYKGYFYSSLDVEGRHYLDSLSSLHAVQEFQNQLYQGPSSLPAEFYLWYSTLAQSEEGKLQPIQIILKIPKLPTLGAPSLFRWYEEVQRLLNLDSPEFSRIARELVSRFDSRPSHRLYLQDIAYQRLADVHLADKLCRSIVDSTGYPDASKLLNCAHFIGNDELIYRYLASGKGDSIARGGVLFLLKRDTPNDPRIRTEFQNAIRSDPASWYLRSQYIEYERDKKNYSAAIRTIQDWLDKYSARSSGFDAIYAHIRLSRTYNLMGQYQKAWDSIEPVIDSWQGTALNEAVDSLDRLNRKKESLGWAEAAMKRYPGNLPTRVNYARILWRNGRYQEAAQAMKSYGYFISGTDWCYTISNTFAEVFAREQTEKVLTAAFALLDAGIPAENLMCLDNEIAKQGNDQLAFDLESAFYRRAPNPYLLFDCYRYLMKLKGKDEAARWMGEKVPVDQRNQFCVSAFLGKQYDLLWDFIQEPNPADHADTVWLIRAAVSVLTGPSDPHRKSVSDYFQKPGTAFIHKLGQYLMGAVSEKELLQLADSKDKKCQSAFYIGIKAHGEGRYEEASDWYRITKETGLTDDLSYKFADRILNQWVQTGRGLWYAAKERL